jgi:hypothetical protein
MDGISLPANCAITSGAGSSGIFRSLSLELGSALSGDGGGPEAFVLLVPEQLVGIVMFDHVL